jgi:6-methylsalicylate decarboxylase
MKTLFISKSILSISSPGTHLKEGDDTLARKVTHECNTYASDLCRRHPQQFGFWASLPLPDIEGCPAEIPYALDELNADGVTFETNIRGRYLGDKAFDPIFDELNRRKAKVFLHPTTPCVKDCHAGQGPHYTAALTQYPNPMFEFMFDTARAVINLFLSGTVARCPNITFIIPHAGGALVPLVQRFTRFAPYILGIQEHVSNDVVREMFRRQFYFDLAGCILTFHPTYHSEFFECRLEHRLAVSQVSSHL